MVWQPGESGNIEGQKRSKPISDALKTFLSRDGEEKITLPPKATYAQLIAAKLLEMALKGDLPAIKECADRVEGRAIQQIEVKKADPFEELTADDVNRIRDRLTGRRAITLDQNPGSRIEVPQVGTLQAVQKTTRIS